MMVWFVVSGLIHFVVEGTFAVWTDYYKDASGNFLADMCKDLVIIQNDEYLIPST